VVAGAVSSLGATAPALAPTATDGSLPDRATRRTELDAEVYHVADRFGDLGAASPLFGLLAAWNDGHDEVIAVGFGDGAGADALSFAGRVETDLERDTEALSYPDYLRKYEATPPGGEA
jgi:hydroxymethylglutaryl-CoA synthase